MDLRSLPVHNYEFPKNRKQFDLVYFFSLVSSVVPDVQQNPWKFCRINECMPAFLLLMTNAVASDSLFAAKE